MEEKKKQKPGKKPIFKDKVSFLVNIDKEELEFFDKLVENRKRNLLVRELMKKEIERRKNEQLDPVLSKV